MTPHRSNFVHGFESRVHKSSRGLVPTFTGQKGAASGLDQLRPARKLVGTWNVVRHAARVIIHWQVHIR